MKIDKKIIELLEKVGNLWPPPYNETQLRSISPTWQKKLWLYDKEILFEAYEYLAESFHRKPYLADFVEKCKILQKQKQPFAPKIIKTDFIDHFEYRSKMAAEFGEEIGKSIDEEYRSYQKAKENGKLKEYTEEVLKKIKWLPKKL